MGREREREERRAEQEGADNEHTDLTGPSASFSSVILHSDLLASSKNAPGKPLARHPRALQGPEKP